MKKLIIFLMLTACLAVSYACTQKESHNSNTTVEIPESNDSEHMPSQEDTVTDAVLPEQSQQQEQPEVVPPEQSEPEQSDGLASEVKPEVIPDSKPDSALVPEETPPPRYEPDTSDTTQTLVSGNEKDVYFLGNNCFKSIGKYDENSVNKFVSKLSSIKQTHLTDVKSIHFSIIPDKLYYADTQQQITNYDALFEKAQNGLSDISYINLKNTLSLSDYHLSDHHWKQENIIKVANELGKNMDFSVVNDYEIKEFSPYVGTYAPHYTEVTVPDEKLCYLENKYTTTAKVESFDNPNNTAVYNTDKLNSNTPYDMYLSGPSALVKITSDCESGRKLILFGDSFSSSLAPILTQIYSEITIVDLRYMHSSLLSEYVEFTPDSEVLFLYCANIVNSSYMLK